MWSSTPLQFLFFISLIISDIEHLFMCLLAICMSYLEKYLYGLLPFFEWVGFCCYRWIVWAIFIFWRLTCCHSHHLQIFSPIPYVILFFMASFAIQKLISLSRSHLFIFYFISVAFRDWPKKTLVWFVSESVLPIISSRSFMVSFYLSL